MSHGTACSAVEPGSTSASVSGSAPATVRASPASGSSSGSGSLGVTGGAVQSVGRTRVDSSVSRKGGGQLLSASVSTSVSVWSSVSVSSSISSVVGSGAGSGSGSRCGSEAGGGSSAGASGRAAAIPGSGESGDSPTGFRILGLRLGLVGLGGRLLFDRLRRGQGIVGNLRSGRRGCADVEPSWRLGYVLGRHRGRSAPRRPGGRPLRPAPTRRDHVLAIREAAPPASREGPSHPWQRWRPRPPTAGDPAHRPPRCPRHHLRRRRRERAPRRTARAARARTARLDTARAERAARVRPRAARAPSARSRPAREQSAPARTPLVRPAQA